MGRTGAEGAVDRGILMAKVKRKPFVDVVVVPGMMEIIKLSDRIRFFHGNEITKEPLLCYYL